MSEAMLIGREPELAVLDAALATAAAGQPQVVVVEGAAGVGKSTLMRGFRDHHRHVAVLAWAGDEAETRLSFGMVGQLVDAGGPWADPFTAGADLLAQVGELSAARPLLLALDDVHLADRPSLVALNFAVRRLRHDPVLVLLAARPNHIGDLPPSLVRMATDSGRHLILEGLSISGVQELANALGVGAISRRAAGRLQSVTDGNPLHLGALLTEVPMVTLEQLDRPIPAPQSFTQLVLAELASAPAAVRTVATVAAVLGDHCELDLLVAVAALGEDAGLAAVDELARRRLLRIEPGSTQVEFAHPLIRAAVYGDLGPGARAGLHRAAAAALEGRAALRHRIAAAHGPDPDLAVDLEAWAHHRLETGELSRAAEAMAAAHRASPPGGDADRRLLRAVGLFAVAGDARGAQALAAAVAALPVSGRQLAIQARLAWLTGRPDDAVALGHEAWEHGDLDASERDLLAAMLAHIEILRDRADEAISWASRALADGRLEPVIASHTRGQRLLGLAVTGRHAEALGHLDELPADPRCVEVGRHPELSMRGHLKMWEHPLSDCRPDLEVAAELTHGDLQPFRLAAAAALGLTFFREGSWDRCRATQQQALALAEDMDQTWMLGFLHAECALVPSARGDWTTAEREVTTALSYAATAGDHATAAYADEAAVLLATARGEPETVLAATERLRGTPDGSPQRDLGMFWWPVHLVSALIELGQLDEADAELALLDRRARPGGRRTGAARLRAAGQLAAARHELHLARQCFDQALAVPEEYVDFLERALAIEAYGRFLRRRGERRSAIDRLRAARARYQRLGAAPFLERCDRELAACGIHDPEATMADDPLTPQERAVAALICSGKTNRQAAQELVLSVKTIGYHLANVYAKLGVHTRAQLVEAMRAHHH